MKPNIWDDLRETLHAGFTESGYSGDGAENATRVAVDALHSMYAGERFGYLPKKRAVDAVAAVEYAKKNGTARAASKFAVSVRTIQRQRARMLGR